MIDWPTLLPMALLLVVAGGFAGVMAGLLGVGGGIILVPAYFYIFNSMGYGGDQLMQVCLGTSLATIIITSMRSVSSHHKNGAVDWDILRSWTVGIVIGAGIGVLIAAQLRSTVLQGIFGGLAIIVGLYLVLGRENWRLGTQMPTGFTRAAVSPVLGFMSVLMGIGGGSFGVPMMTLYSVPMHRAVATAAGFGAIIALPATLGFLLLNIPEVSQPPFSIGAVNMPAFGLTIVMTLLTAPLGVKLAHKTDAKRLKRVFGAFLVLVALNMLRKAYGA